MVERVLEATALVLAERGYAGISTNLIADRAGVSVGSLYQYFPNKDALVTALHERHAAQMGQIIEQVLCEAHPRGLRGHIDAIVRALVAAHRLEPALHKVLEKELPFFEPPKDQSPADNVIFSRISALLGAHREQISQANLDLATWTVLRIMESLVHAAVIDPPARFGIDAIEQSIVEAIVGYLVAPQAEPTASALRSSPG
ncbi:MAG TPA: TetR/AcrR family transcriptional regulator [Rhodopila sp.]